MIKNVLLLLAAAVLLIGGAEAMDKTDDLAARIALHTSQISGRTEPHRIPYLSKMNFLFLYYHRIHRSALSTFLEDPDVSKLDQFVAGKEKRHAEINAEIERRETAICNSRMSMDASEIAPLIVGIDEYYERSMTDHYERTIGSLTEKGRKAVLEYVDREITPNLSVGIIDRLALLSEFPALVEAQLDMRCSGDTTRFEDSAKRIIERLQREAEENEGNSGFGREN